jgi:hypothetical protein
VGGVDNLLRIHSPGGKGCVKQDPARAVNFFPAETGDHHPARSRKINFIPGMIPERCLPDDQAGRNALGAEHGAHQGGIIETDALPGIEGLVRIGNVNRNRATGYGACQIVIVANVLDNPVVDRLNPAGSGINARTDAGCCSYTGRLAGKIGHEGCRQIGTKTGGQINREGMRENLPITAAGNLGIDVELVISLAELEGDAQKFSPIKDLILITSAVGGCDNLAIGFQRNAAGGNLDQGDTAGDAADIQLDAAIAAGNDIAVGAVVISEKGAIIFIGESRIRSRYGRGCRRPGRGRRRRRPGC